MARRTLLTETVWDELTAPPTSERDLIKHATLTRDDLDAVARKRTGAGRLGYAVLLVHLRHPGRVPGREEYPPAELLDFLADQVDAAPADYDRYIARSQTRREHLSELMGRLGYRAGFTHEIFQ